MFKPQKTSMPAFNWTMVGLLSCATVAIACAGEDPAYEPVGTVKQAGGFFPGLHVGDPLSQSMWDRNVNGRYEIHVCFSSGNLNANTVRRGYVLFEDDMDRAFNSLKNTWGQAAPIDFVRGDGVTIDRNGHLDADCNHYSQPVPEAWIPITLVYNSENAMDWPSSYTGMGRGHREAPCVAASVCADCTSPCQIRMGYGDEHNMFNDDVAHEVGHVLGLIQESDRGDFPDYVTCNGVQQGPFAHDPNNAVQLTAKPDFASIMSPKEASCFKEMNRDNYGLSAGDKFTISMLYPWTLNRTTGSTASTKGMYTAAGVVIRSDGSVTTDWYVKGADPGVFMGGPTWTVYTAGGGQIHPPDGLQMSASYLANGSNDVGFAYKDYFGRDFTGRAPVIKNSALHTALVMSTLRVSALF